MGVLDAVAKDLFATYDAEITFRDRLMGGVPSDPKIVEGWLRSKAGISNDAEVERAMHRTLRERGVDLAAISPDAQMEAMYAASEELASEVHTNGFKRDERGLYLESRCVKAGIKEATNVLFASERWGKTKKGAKSFLAERAFIDPDRLHFGAQEPAGVYTWVGHVAGARGKQSTLGYYEYMEGASIRFQVRSTRDEVAGEQWAYIWVQLQELGLGALRSQGFGRFDLTRWDRVE